MNYTNFIYGFNSGVSVFGVLGFGLLLWSLFWKGLALWHASKRDEKHWFIALLVINTFGILELIYLFHFVKVKLNKLW